MVTPCLSQSISSLMIGTAAIRTSLRTSCAHTKGSIPDAAGPLPSMHIPHQHVPAYWSTCACYTVLPDILPAHECQPGCRSQVQYLVLPSGRVLDRLPTSASVLPLNVRTLTSWRCLSVVQLTLSFAISRERLTLTSLSQRHQSFSVFCTWQITPIIARQPFCCLQARTQ